MIGQSLPEYILIIFCIISLRLIAPASLLYIAVSIYSRKLYLHPWLSSYLGLEVAFLFFYLLRRSKLQQEALHKPPQLNKEQRQELFQRCAEEILDVTDTYPIRWFSSPSVKKENVIEWLLWALFSCGPEEALEEWEEEIGMYVKRIEGLLGKNFESGRDATVEAMRLTLDPVKTVHRPLLWYLIVSIVDTYTTLRLLYLGFQHYSTPLWLKIFPARPFSFFSKRAATEHFSYWYRPHKSPDKDPIVFIHGIGIGLYPYIPFLKDLIHSDPNLGILCIEILPISMRITSKPILPRQAMLDAIYTTLASLQIHNAVLASHSFGTVIAAHMIRTHSRGITPAPTPTSTPTLTPVPTSTRSDGFRLRHEVDDGLKHEINITSYLLVDPIPILLHLPDVAYNFLYRVPQHANEWQLWYFASRDPDIAHALGRHFFWTDNVLWKDDLVDVGKGRGQLSSGNDIGTKNGGLDVNVNGDDERDSSSSQHHNNGMGNGAASGKSSVHGRERRPVAVVLSGRDQIIPARSVWKYLTEEDDVKERWVSEDGTLEVLWNLGLDHAMVFDTKERRKGMMEVLERFTSLSKVE